MISHAATDRIEGRFEHSTLSKQRKCFHNIKDEALTLIWHGRKIVRVEKVGHISIHKSHQIRKHFLYPKHRNLSPIRS